MFELHEITPVRCYCGPAALIALTGQDLPVVRAAINRAKGRRENVGVIGTSVREMQDALTDLGYYHQTHERADRPTLLDFAKTRDPGDFWVVNVTGHYVALCDEHVADNRIRFGCPIEEHPCRRKRVKKGILITGRREEADAA